MRDIPVGNGNLLVTFDDKYQIRDVYFPHVGQENHSEGFPFRFGVWVDGAFSWIHDDLWQRTLKYLPDTLVTDVTLRNNSLGLEVVCNDTVVSRESIFLRRVRVTDLSGSNRDIRLFLHHDFRIYENKVGDTAFYDPETLSLIHYKKHRYFLINTEPHFDQFATGRKAFRNTEGTWRDAEDGDLHGGAITEGSVDSTIGINCPCDENGNFEFYYWIAAGTSHKHVAESNRNVLRNGPAEYLDESINYWRNWLRSSEIEYSGLSSEVQDLYRRSLLIVRTQTDHAGAIIAANDHDVTDRATDHYSYLWPRDGAFVANAMDEAGFPDISSPFFSLCQRIVHERGYFLQKYNPDGSVGSGWHSYWDKYERRPMYPIQEDETALVIWALWEHYSKHPGSSDFHELYRHLILKCADFMLAFRDPAAKLPSPSWNLWEDRRGVHTFTCSTVVAGLRAAANFARVYGDGERAVNYDTAASDMVDAMITHLYSRENGRFLRGLLSNGDGSMTPDTTVDASLFGVFYFGCFDAKDEMAAGTMQAIEKSLTNGPIPGGVARFQNDGYMRESDSVVGNTWIICTLWLAEYYIAIAEVPDDLIRARDLIDIVVAMALPSGVLAEQIEPISGRTASVSPLTWSHSTFIGTVLNYQKRSRILANKA
ncbi:MAG: glycoside hydrolase family 15 protein [Pyrinomonadaceae bacterium]|nr:glycoside hydrolase family 15 protein [Pyrinomonadaceae bacterium]MBP6212084.1 glycoside hydrolase family 15 protein [Pyrinomonadaceae bacterium]